MRIYTDEEIVNRRKRKEYIIEKIKLITVIFITIVVIYNISLIVQSIMNPEKTPSFFGKKTFAIISGSMMPTIEVGDIVVVVEVEEQELQEGDIITYRKASEMITHRIERIEEKDGKKTYITKGDNNNTEDAEEVLYNDIEGRVVRTIPKVGNVAIILKNKIAILVILVIFFIMYISDVKNNNKKMMREKKKELLNKRRE